MQRRPHYGTAWPVPYRTPEPDRVATLRELGVLAYAPLVHPYKPGMARWLTEWALEFAARTPAAVPTATLYPEPDVADYLGAAVAGGARGEGARAGRWVRPARPAAPSRLGAPRGRHAGDRALR
jgi:hypothetical protein